MSDPTVACIMLTRDRAEYARRAVLAFRAQTYQNKTLLILDNSTQASGLDEYDKDNVVWIGFPSRDSVGVLRNTACDLASPGGIGAIDADIFAHFDDDDWSHPNRIAEQVALLQASGQDAVGYREVLFWNERAGWDRIDQGVLRSARPDEPCGESYLYTNHDRRYGVGSSLCYWRKSWEREPFEDVNREEDGRWIKKVYCDGYTSFGGPIHLTPDIAPPEHDGYGPRMICRIHAGNARHYPIDELVENCANWKRTPEWDDKCRTIMEGTE